MLTKEEQSGKVVGWLFVPKLPNQVGSLDFLRPVYSSSTLFFLVVDIFSTTKVSTYLPLTT